MQLDPLDVQLAVLALTLSAALVITTLVFALSFRLRAREFATLADLGISPGALALTRGFEVGIVGGAGILIALTLTFVMQANAQAWVRLLLA